MSPSFPAESLATLYTEDETAWLETMADAARRRDVASLDLEHLSEYLTDMAQRDRREVKSRVVIMLTHLLKWEYQPDRRSRSWRTTVLHQRHQLADFASQGVLRTHAEAVLPAAYDRAVGLAMAATDLPRTTFPVVCPYSVTQLLAMELPAGEAD